jgi:hypothetical protein
VDPPVHLIRPEQRHNSPFSVSTQAGDGVVDFLKVGRHGLGVGGIEEVELPNESTQLFGVLAIIQIHIPSPFTIQYERLRGTVIAGPRELIPQVSVHLE